MKVFVAAESTTSDSDYNWAVPGELVHLPPLVCDCPDCGCDRGMGGFVSHRGTSCFVVRDLDLDEDTYTRLMSQTLRDGGWVSGDETWVGDWAKEHLDLAASLPAEVPLMVADGRILVRRLN